MNISESLARDTRRKWMLAERWRREKMGDAEYFKYLLNVFEWVDLPGFYVLCPSCRAKHDEREAGPPKHLDFCFLEDVLNPSMEEGSPE